VNNQRRAVITGIGAYAPEKVLTNADFEKIVDTSDEWIRTRTGILERHIKENGEGSSDLALRASEEALNRAGLTPDDLDLIMVGTVTPDYHVPSTACILQEKMGAFNAAAMDVQAACASFIYGLATASAHIHTGLYKRILVVGVDCLSAVTNYKDRSTCVLFGDGAGAVIVESRNGDGGDGILGNVLRTDGRYAKLLWIPTGGSMQPFLSESADRERVFIEMEGNEVFKIAVRSMVSAAREACEQAGLTVDDLSLLIPHQANIRIINAVVKRLGIAEENVFVNIQKYGNTSSASVPLALEEAYSAGRIKPGDNVMMVAFGGGLTWGASLIRF